MDHEGGDWGALGLLMMRVAAGGMLLFGHGWAKLIGFAERSATFPDPLGIGSPAVSLGLAVFAEVACAAAVVVGLATRLAAIPVVFTMLVAAFVVHAGDPWSRKELALLYALPFATLIFTGAGRFAADRYVGPRLRGK
jgi:putative oxidoreductase